MALRVPNLSQRQGGSALTLSALALGAVSSSNAAPAKIEPPVMLNNVFETVGKALISHERSERKVTSIIHCLKDPLTELREALMKLIDAFKKELDEIGTGINVYGI